METRHQVLVIGGGPVGASLALELGMRGISVGVVERRMQPQRIPKGQNLTQRTLEHFYYWGIADELRAARAMPPGYPIGGVTAYRNLMSEYWIQPPQRETVAEYYFQANERLPQYHLEEVVRRRMNDFPNIEAQYGWAAESLEQDETSVRVTIREEGGTVRKIVEADYVIGCDGAHSVVRDQIGIKRTGSDFDQLMVLAVFRSKELHEGLERFPPRSTYNVLHPDLKGYWQFFGRIDVGEGWFFHAPVPADTTRDNYDFHGLIQKVAGFPFAAEFDHVGFWDLRVSVAEEYQNRRVFIAGDSAHSHPPYGGFGLNNGLEDAVNIGWKLAARLDGWGTDVLLDTYSEERHPIFRDTGEDFIAARIKRDSEFLEHYSPEKNEEEFARAWKEREYTGGMRAEKYVPHYEGSSVVMGEDGAICGAHGVHTFTARIGHHLPPQPLSMGANVFEKLGTGFTLLAFGQEDGTVRAFQAAAEKRGIPLTCVHDSFDGGREKYEQMLILVRPDQFVAWTGNEGPEDASAILGQVSGQTG